MHYFIIPCGGQKADVASAARDLYTSPNFRLALAAAEAEAEATERDLGEEATVLILSAKHGLLALDEVVAPYDVKMGDAGSITPEAITAQAAEVMVYGDAAYAMVPKDYRKVVTAALAPLDVLVHDVYEASPGIGYMRGTCGSITRSADLVLA